MPRYLVTGGCGFIGSHLVSALVNGGHQVVVLDDLSTGHRHNLDERALFVAGDAGDPAMVARAMRATDGCFHLAAVASVQRSREDWIGTHRINQTATLVVLNAARTARNGLPIPVVYASSAAVYGNASAMPVSELTPAVPLTAYGADKLGCELHAAVAWQQFAVPTTGLRFFNVYGPRQDPHSPYSGVVSIFSDRLARGLSLTIQGDGCQVRDFLYVDDAVAYLTAAMASDHRSSRVFNACTGSATSILHLARHIAAALGKSVDMSHAPARPGDIRTSVGDPGAARQALSVGASVPVADGVARLLASSVTAKSTPVT